MTIRKHGKKLLALLLALSLSMGILPAFADEGETTEESTENEEVIVDAGEQRNNDQDQLEIKFNEVANDEVETLNMVVDESKVICHPTADWYGISDGTIGEVLGTENAYFEKNGKGPEGLKMDTRIVDSFKSFKGVVTVARYGGTWANNADWKKSADKNWAYRQPYTAMYWDTGYESAENDALTIVDFCKSFLAINEDIKFHICVNMTTDDEIDVADLVEFLEGDGITNYNGGENWAKKRIEMGLKEPLKNVCYELGNEIEWSHNIKRRDWTKENYVAVARRFIAAIRSVNEDAYISALTPCALWSRNGDDWSEWHRYVLMELGDQIDVLDFHAYNAYRQACITLCINKSFV